MTLTSPSTSSSTIEDDDIYDDACDLGQFFLNPTWYLYVKISAALLLLSKQQKKDHSEQPKDSDSDTDTLAASTTTIGKRSSSSSSSLLLLLPYQRTLYILFLTVGWGLTFGFFYPLARASPWLMDDRHLTCGYAIFVACLLTWWMASVQSPGVIQSSNLARYDIYDYDYVLYHPTDVVVVMVETTTAATKSNSSNNPNSNPNSKIAISHRRLARSKLDRHSQQYIARFDHYCGWLQRPIGQGNYSSFLLFVAVHCGMCTYGAYLVGLLLLFRNHVGGGGGDAGTSDVAAAAAAGSTTVALVLLWLLLSCASIALMGFSSFHGYLVATNQTTAEYYKRKAMMMMTNKVLMTTTTTALDADTVETSSSTASAHCDEELAADNHANIHNRKKRSFTTTSGCVSKNHYDKGIVGNILEVWSNTQIFGTMEGVNSNGIKGD
jgi:DHHC palmitoyltransferase